jgi:hypothetical protein
MDTTAVEPIMAILSTVLMAVAGIGAILYTALWLSMLVWRLLDWRSARNAEHAARPTTRDRFLGGDGPTP